MKTSVKSEETLSNQPPLAGLRLLDLTRLLPGPMATLHLADLGADVVKVEDTGAGDYARWMGPLQKSHSGWFLAINRNKRSICLDLKSSSGHREFLALVANADAVVESFRPGVMARLGLDFEALRSVNPSIVLASISGYGQTGPDSGKAGHDINYTARSGILDQSGAAKGPPAPGNFQSADLAGGALSCVMGLLAALLSVARGGPGRHVDIAMTDCVAAHNIMGLMEAQTGGPMSDRGCAYLSGGQPNYRIYQTSDQRFFAVGALEEKFWHLFCETLSLPSLASTDLNNAEHCAATAALLEKHFARQPLDHWTQLFANVDCCVGPVLDLMESMQDPQLVSRGVFFTATHPMEGNVTQFACPVKMSGYSFELKRHAPMVGEHTDEIRAEWTRRA